MGIASFHPVHYFRATLIERTTVWHQVNAWAPAPRLLIFPQGTLLRKWRNLLRNLFYARNAKAPKWKQKRIELPIVAIQKARGRKATKRTRGDHPLKLKLRKPLRRLAWSPTARRYFWRSATLRSSANSPLKTLKFSISGEKAIAEIRNKWHIGFDVHVKSWADPASMVRGGGDFNNIG